MIYYAQVSFAIFAKTYTEEDGSYDHAHFHNTGVVWYAQLNGLVAQHRNIDESLDAVGGIKVQEVDMMIFCSMLSAIVALVASNQRGRA